MGHSYRELISWQKAMDFVMDVYRTTKSFLRDETYALAGQLRRAAVAIPANIAEGQAASPLTSSIFFWEEPEDR